MLELPKRLSILCRFNGCPMKGCWVSVRLGMRHKNPHVLLFGPTDEDGRLTVSREDLVAQAEEEARLAPMDFLHPSDEFDGNVLVTPLDRHRIQAALDAHDTWSKVSPYPKGYRESLVGAAQELIRVGDGQLSVDVVAE